jgi:prolyl 4-hydroxylase
MANAAVDYKIALGLWLKDRLSRNPAVFQIPSHQLDIFVARDFLTPDECTAMIALIDAARVPSELLAPMADPEFRTSESCNMDPDHPLVRQIEDKLTDLLGIAPEHGETIQGQRYGVGQQFKPHHDYFYTDQAYWPAMEQSGGQRTWTAMVFLNMPEEGGQTAFPETAIRVSPRPGNLLAWNNLDAKGEPNHCSLHQGCPVVAGAKYIITKWYRERPWSYTGVQTY